MALALSLLSLAAVSPVDNGALALAAPVKSIAIDGETSDWPATALPYAIDETTTMRVAYSATERMLYACVESKDTGPTGGSRPWDERDTCLFYIDRTHSARGSGPACFAVHTGGIERLTSQGTWDPAVREITLEQVEGATGRREDTTVFEFRVQLERVHAGATLGFDVVRIDAEEGEETDWLAWGPRLSKSRAAGRLGDVLLTTAATEFGTLQGEVRWAAGQETEWTLPRVRITSLDNPRLWTQVAVVDGKYSVELPIGRYAVTSAFPVLGDFYTEPSRVLRRGLRVVANVLPSGTQAEPFLLDSVPPPDLMQGRGLLFDYEESDAEHIDRFLTQAMDHLGVPGASVALVKDGRVVYHRALGVKNAYTGEPVTAATLFEACSVTKIVFAFAANRLIERGVLDLDRPLHEVLALKDLEHDERHKEITARHVLTHRSGLPNWRSGALELEFDPGTRFGYSGEAFEYLGRVIEELTGRDLEGVLREEVLEPFGFPAWFKDSEELAALASHGHHSLRPNAAIAPSELGVAHSMHVEPRSFANFMIGLLDGVGLTQESYADMLRFHSERAPGDTSEAVPWRRGFGLGFSVMETPFGPAFGHAGSNGDFHCLFEAYPDQNAGFLIFANNEKAWTLTELFRKFLVGPAG